MLELRPNCEYCDRDLPPQSTLARICSYECTFCADCVEQHLHNVCPNCGGGFVPRPIRPRNAYRSGVSLQDQPASDRRVQLRHDKQRLAGFISDIAPTPPEKR
ncbi:MAG: DUF1272 domain-containing protein [Gammaproteobacteria bacterium]|nr:DUF1272 domain-containing protein [Gammaproteobacteria bacterium]NND60487.1 DUF1272 domain-containing protein [Gammaproteobacteria bacterium]